MEPESGWDEPVRRTAGIFAIGAGIEDDGVDGDEFSMFDDNFNNPLAKRTLRNDDEFNESPPSLRESQDAESGFDDQPEMQFDGTGWVTPALVDGGVGVGVGVGDGGMFSASNPLQVLCTKLASSPAVDNTIVVVTFMNAVTLAVNPPGFP